MARYRDFDDELEEEYDEEQDDYRYEEPVRKKTPQNPKTSKNKKKKKRTGLKVAIIVVEILVLLALAAVFYVTQKLGKIEYNPINVDDIDNNFAHETVTNEQGETQTADSSNYQAEVLEGYTNILLLGSDARDNSIQNLLKTEENHTDSIIIASINNETKEVKLVSIYRDTLLKMVDTKNGGTKYTYDKATEAMFWFGVESALSMVNTCFDLDITDYVMVNWNALIDIIDAVGGIDLEITEDELYWLNAYLVDTSENTNRTYEEVPAAGYVHLDGIQATAFCRIRYCKTVNGTNDDYGRTERQRTVINLLVEKAKKMNLTQLDAAINSICNNIATSFSADELISMAMDIAKYSIGETKGFPFELSYSAGKTIYTDYPYENYKVVDMLVIDDLEKNVSELHEFLFGVENYEPTAGCKKISEELNDILGLD